MAQKRYGISGANVRWGHTGTNRGRGIFAAKPFRKGEMIEQGPVIIVAANAIPDDGGAPDGYLLDWNPEVEGEEHCMPLGYIMMYNHSAEPNIRMENDEDEMTITAFAIRDIVAGEELTWDYNCEIWFDED
jgi:hypothetical protein